MVVSTSILHVDLNIKDGFVWAIPRRLANNFSPNPEADLLSRASQDFRTHPLATVIMPSAFKHGHDDLRPKGATPTEYLTESALQQHISLSESVSDRCN